MLHLIKNTKKQSLTTVSLLLFSLVVQAQTFSVGTLPAGKTIVVTYETDVDADACPDGTLAPANLSNQSNVSGTNFGTVQTNDPGNPAPDPGATLTPVTSYVVGNLVYHDVNRDGDYDAGTDAGINGVLVRIYEDVNANNMLDAGDGAALGTYTTTTLSGQAGSYAFNVCPGTYIVEVAASNFLSDGPLFTTGDNPKAYVTSPIAGGADPDTDTDDNDNNGSQVAGFGVASAAFTVSADELKVDFGFKTPAIVSINNVTQSEGNGGGTTTYSFTVSRSVLETEDEVTFTVNTSNDLAVAPGDFTAITDGSLTLGIGVASANIDVLVNADNLVEPQEDFLVVLTDEPPHAEYEFSVGAGLINNDDNATVTLSGGTSQNEGTSYTFTATLDNPVQGGFSIAFTTNNGTATLADNDYTDNDGLFVFAGTAGEEKTFTVNTTTDNKVELNETFTANLGAITGAPAGVTTAGSPQTGTITNDDAAVVNLAADVTQAENLTPQAFSVTLSNPVDVSVTVNFSTTDGTATTADNDYTGIVSQTVTFPAGSTASQTVNVAITNDNKVEANEGYDVSIGSLNAAGRNVTLAASSRTGTINNDDAAVVTLSGGGSANEGNTGTTPRTFMATLNNPVQGGFSIAYTTNDGTATTANNDYADNDGTLNFDGTMGETENITVQVNGDFFVEANETFTVELGAITGAPAGVSTAGSPQTATITNDEVDFGDGPDSLPTILFNNGARHTAVLGFHLGATIDGDPDGQGTGGTHSNLANGDDNDAEGDDEDGVTLPGVFVTGTTATITVNASQAGKLDAFMDFNWNRQLSDAGEKIFNNVALTAGDNILSFVVPAGATVGSSFLRFRFSSAGGLGPGGLATDGEVEDYRTNIVSNQFSINNPSVVEGDAGPVNLVYTVTRTTNSTASSVDYAITGGTATSGTDYTPLAAGTLNFAMGGALSQDITVSVLGDVVVEDNETIIITLSNPVNGGLGANPGTGTINNNDNATLTLSGGIAQNEGNTGTVAYTFNATLSAAVQGGFTAPYTTNNGTATTADNDYTDNDGNLVFAGTAGEVKTFTVNANGDNKVELNENFTTAIGTLIGSSAVQLAAITIGGSPQTGTITNDDAATVAIAANVTQAENLTPQAFSVTLSNPVDVSVTVNFSTTDGTATTADNDYTGIASQTVTFPAGSTISQTVNVAITNDNKVEANEGYDVSIASLNAAGRNVNLGTSSRTGTITNDDAATVTLSGGTSQDEGNAGTTPYVFSATLNNPVQGGFTANYTTNDGTATTANNDYVDNDGSLSFTGTMGEVKTFTVNVNGDLNIEANETFQTAINSLTGVVNPGAVTIVGSPQTATITNDEQDWGDAPTAAQSGFAGTYPTLNADNGARHAAALGGLKLGPGIDGDLDGQPNATATGDGADEDGVTLPGALVLNTSANITVNASGTGNLNAWIDWNRDGDWVDAGEQVFTNQAVSAGNNTLTIAVPAGASIGGSFARFRLSTAAGTGITGLATDGEVEDYGVNIVNTQFSVNDPVVNEGNAGTTNLTFTITRTNNATACSVDYAITGGTATAADNDYQVFTAGTANFTAGGSLTATFNVVVTGDVKVELNETVDITLSNPVNGAILDGAGTGTITNDDAATLTITNPTVTEGDGGTVNATFTINMSNPADANVSVNFATVDGSATLANNDYQNTNGTHTFTPGQTSKTVSVPVNGDCNIEANETFLLRLSGLVNNGRNVSLSGGGATLDGTGTINNDDALPVITCPGNLTVNAAAGLCQATVTLTLPTLSSVCGASTLEFRYRTVDEAGLPTGVYTGYFPSGSNTVIFPVNRYQIEWRITDGSGSSTCSLFLRVVDNQPPTIVCPVNQTIPANASCMSAIGTWLPTSVGDNCTPAGLIMISQTPPSNTVLMGHGSSVLVTLTATDQNLNNSTCSFTVTLRDQTTPIARCKNATVNLNSSGVATVPASAINNGTTDNCTFSLAVIPATFTCANIGNNTVVLRATDAGGNTSTCTAVVTIRDVSGPNALCKNPTIFLNSTGQATLSVSQVDNGSSDPCGIATMTISKTLFNCSEIGSPQPVTLNLTDVYGNASSCLSNVTVKDITAPTAICEDVTVELNALGRATVYGAELAGESYDNCSVWSYSPVAKVYNTSNIGVNNLTITVRDWSNNAATCVSVVTVEPFNFQQMEDRGAPTEELDMVLYPNPAEDLVMAAFVLPLAQPFALRIFDLSGRMVYSRTGEGAEGENTLPIELEGIASGIYWVDLQSEGLKRQKRLVVQRN
jgi:hypothetical protein